MVTKKFIIEVEEGDTDCIECPLRITSELCTNTKCSKINLATMKIEEYEEDE